MGLNFSSLLGGRRRRKSKNKSHQPLPLSPVKPALKPGNIINSIKYGAERQCKIISTVLLEDDVFDYFVIYINPNAHRRNDEWVRLEQLDMESLMPYVEVVTPEELARVRIVEFIQLRRNEIRTWYPSPIMSEFEDSIKLHVCECCITFKNSKSQLKRHKKECQGRDPPGHMTYIDGKLSVFQIDGAQNKDYCDNLCHLGNMFLDSKRSFETTESSMFYVLVVRDDSGYDLIAFFSEVKQMMEPYGSSRFVCLPPYQRHGYVALLVRLACELKRGEDAGAFSYYSKFWNWIVVSREAKHLLGQSYEALSRLTEMPPEDVRTTLLDLRELERDQRRYKYHFSLYTGIHDALQTGVELCNTENLDTEVDGCPEFDVDSVIWPHHQERMKALFLLFLSISLGLVTFIPRFL